MDTNAIIDVVIGLTLLYLLLSLGCTVVNELISTFFKLRARDLSKTLNTLVDDPNFRQLFDGTGLMQSITKMSGGKGPSYLPSKTFALAVLEALSPERPTAESEAYGELVGTIEKMDRGSHLRGALLSLARNGAGQADRLKEDIAEWFDDMMDRAGGRYKRKMKAISFGVGLAIAVSINADTISIAKTLWADPTLRAQLVESASEFAAETDYSDDLLDLREIQADLAPFPLGWDLSSETFATDWYMSWIGWLSKVLGLLLTALALTLGAPFWFDMLSKFVKLRGAGGKPATQAVKKLQAAAT